MPNATDPIDPIDLEEWAEIESRFRLWSFGVYYRKTFSEERHLLKRFVKALLASTQPIQDRDMVVRWYRQRSRRAPDDA